MKGGQALPNLPFCNKSNATLSTVEVLLTKKNHKRQWKICRSQQQEHYLNKISNILHQMIKIMHLKTKAQKDK